MLNWVVVTPTYNIYWPLPIALMSGMTSILQQWPGSVIMFPGKNKVFTLLLLSLLVLNLSSLPCTQSLGRASGAAAGQAPARTVQPAGHTVDTDTTRVDAKLSHWGQVKVTEGKKMQLLTSVCRESGRKLHTFLTASSICASVAFFSRILSMYVTAILHTSQ